MPPKAFKFQAYTPTKKVKKAKDTTENFTANGTPIKKKRGRPVGWRKNTSQIKNEETDTIEEAQLTKNIIETEEEESLSLLPPNSKRGRFSKLNSVENEEEESIANNNEEKELNLIIVSSSSPRKKPGRPKGAKNFKTLEKESNSNEVTAPIKTTEGRGRGRKKQVTSTQSSTSNQIEVNGSTSIEAGKGVEHEVDGAVILIDSKEIVEPSPVVPKGRRGRKKKTVTTDESSQPIEQPSEPQAPPSPIKRRGRKKANTQTIDTVEINSEPSNSQQQVCLPSKRGRKKANEIPSYPELNDSDDDYLIEIDNEVTDKDYNEVDNGSDNDSDENIDEEFDSDEEDIDENYEESNAQRKTNGHTTDSRSKIKTGKFKPINLTNINYDNWVEEYDPLVKPIVYIPPNAQKISNINKKSATTTETKFPSLFPDESTKLIELRYKMMLKTQKSLKKHYENHFEGNNNENYHRDNSWKLTKLKWLINQLIYFREEIQNRRLFPKLPIITLEIGLNDNFQQNFNTLLGQELSKIKEKFFIRYCNLNPNLLNIRNNNNSQKFKNLILRIFCELAKEFSFEGVSSNNQDNNNDIELSTNLEDFKTLLNEQDIKRHDGGDHRMNLNIILLPAWENWDLKLIEQLINYLIPLQTILILPTSTNSSDTLPTLPYELTSQLDPLKLNFQNPWKELELGLNFLDSVELEGLYLGIWPLLRLGKRFCNSSYSTSNWFTELKWIILDYYKSNPLSILRFNSNTSNYINSLKSEIIPNLSPNHFEIIRSLPSFKQWFNSSNNNLDKLRLIEDDNYLTNNFLMPKLLLLKNYLTSYRLGFELFIQLQNWLYQLEAEDTQLDSKLFLKLEGLSRGLINSNSMSNLLTKVELLNFNNLTILLKSILIFVTEQKSKLIKKLSSIDKFLDYLEELKGLLVKFGEGNYNFKNTPNWKLANILGQYFKIVLQPNYEIPLSELVFITDDTLIQSTFEPNLTDSLNMDLQHPELELANSTKFIPDLSIMYEIYLECGRLINLFDWSQTFKDRLKLQCEELGEVYSEKLAWGRFFNCLETFKLFGLVATTKRKTDHVVKLI